MQTNENNHIEELLPRYCEGTLSEEEKEVVRKWMLLSEDNRRVVKQIHALLLATDSKVIRRDIDTEMALAKVSSRIYPPGKKRESLFIWVQRIAATLFIPLLIAYGMQFANGGTASIDTIEVKTNPGMTTSIMLPDGSMAYLNSETTLTYPSRFTGNTREVRVEGEAFFMVEKDAGKKFIVETPHQSKIEVLGTHFNVDAYKDERSVSATLIEGKIRFHYTEGGISKSILLTSGQKLINKITEDEIQIIKTSGESESAWKDGKIIFSNTSMDEALRMLEKRYNVKFIVLNKNLLDNSFTGTFTHQRLERILEYFKVSSKINWRYLDPEDINKEKSEIEIS